MEPGSETEELQTLTIIVNVYNITVFIYFAKRILSKAS